ncbi:MAG TPA: flagellar motor protein MotB [Kofleriaceae bacterium]|jgi:chemotaxis protein MotB|nr:flagellar motor protein MotB [Kofleriaceae bacterium]
MSDVKMDEKSGRVISRPAPRGSSAVKAWLLAILALGGCGALAYFYWQLHQAHSEQKGQLKALQPLADDHPKQKQRADEAEGKLNTLQTQFDDQKKQLDKLEEDKKFTASELAKLEELKKEADERAAAFERFKAGFKQMIDEKVLEVERREGRLIVRMPAEVLFPIGSADLSEKGKVTLLKLSGILEREIKDKFRLMVAGHTDNAPIQAGPTSKYKSNWELSTARAVTVTELLVTAGIPPKNLVAAGYGEFAPISDNKDNASRARNRRIEIILLPDVDVLTSDAEKKPG